MKCPTCKGKLVTVRKLEDEKGPYYVGTPCKTCRQHGTITFRAWFKFKFELFIKWLGKD